MHRTASAVVHASLAQAARIARAHKHVRLDFIDITPYHLPMSKSWQRRHVLQLGLLTLPALACARRPRRVIQSREPGPRYVLNIYLRGGWDAIWTSDPKTRNEVETDIDVPYPGDAIITAGNVQYGPHMRPIRRWLSRSVFVRGVQTYTANHHTGSMQNLRLKTRVTYQHPGIVDLIGKQSPRGQPLTSVALGPQLFRGYSGGMFSLSSHRQPDGSQKDLLQELYDTDPVDLLRLAATQRKQAEKLRASGAVATTAERHQAADHMERSAALMERLPDIPPPSLEKWPADLDGLQDTGRLNPHTFYGGFVSELQRALWFIENDLTRGIFYRASGGWDSHFQNTNWQTISTIPFFFALARFMDELSTRSNAHGPLLDNTVIVVSSELGRFPQLNDVQGKDHLPVTQVLLWAKDIPKSTEGGEAYGGTGRRMEPLPVDVQTGRPGGSHMLSLDDIGATLLTMTGLNPELYGYTGVPLPFLLRARS